MAHILISAANKSSGKTVLSIGISAAFHQQGLAVQTFKKGPDYIDPMWLAKATHRNSYNLDFWTQSETEITTTFSAHNHDADISIIEGNKGLHDGLAADGSNSNAALAKHTDAPVILVLDTRGTIRGVAPLLLGYQQFDPAVNIAGVILNFVGGERHAAKLRTVIERYTDIPILGMVQRNAELELVERYLGLMPSNEDQYADTKISRIAEIVSEQVDLEKINAIANAAKVPLLEKNTHKYEQYALKIAYADDEAFGFYYADDLDTFRQHGVQLIAFNTLHDESLPEADALFIGGGFPEKRMHELAANTNMKRAIHHAIEKDMPAYAECGGLMYLSNAIQYENQRAEMVGIINADCEMHEKPIGRGYTLLQNHADHPWNTSANSKTDIEIPGHEFHYSKLNKLPQNPYFAYNVNRGFGINGQNDGVIYKNLLACYAHQRNTQKNQWILNFLEFIKSKS
ncbi:MAG: cobyrinate a,c-diamide synthase [Gammaproteobacteria bacterium]